MQETVVLAGKIVDEAYMTHGSSACAPYEKFYTTPIPLY